MAKSTTVWTGDKPVIPSGIKQWCKKKDKEMRKMLDETVIKVCMELFNG